MVTAAEIEARLASIVGLPLWSITRAATLASFQFGPRQLVTQQAGPRAGTQKEVGSHALHVQCAWRIHGHAGVLVESEDGEPDGSAARSERWDFRAEAFLRNVCPLRVLAVRADATGGLRLELENGYALEVSPDQHVAGEQWRCFSPYQASAHAVFSDGHLRDE